MGCETKSGARGGPANSLGIKECCVSEVQLRGRNGNSIVLGLPLHNGQIGLRAINPGSSSVDAVRPIAAVALLLVTACGGGSVGATTSAPSATTSSTEVGATTIPGETTTTAGGETTTTNDRMQAPDFTLQLGNGGSYTLSEGSKPVYLVFWAEW
jgi:hypothetical protein